MDANTPNLLQSIAEALKNLVSTQSLMTAITVILILVAGFGLARLLFKVTKKFARKALPLRSAAILENLIKYGGYTLVILTAIKRAGFDISAFLGAAGIAGIALGFAAQTSVANIISGIFLVSEHAFKIGDVLQIDALTGVVETIDLMCVRIRTFDNRLVRVPNETLIKSNIINVTHYPRRRADFWLTIPNGCDYALVLETLQAILAAEPLALDDPTPTIVFDAATPDGTTVLVGAWCLQQDFLPLKNKLIPALVGGLADKGIQPQARKIEVVSAVSSEVSSKRLG